MNTQTRVVLLGTRGSVPVGGEAFCKYGGDSSCVLVQMGGETILLDAGSGILRAEPYLEAVTDLHILISHVHIDHILGLPFFMPLYNPLYSVGIYSPLRGGLPVREQIASFMAPPLWPTGIEVFSPGVHFVNTQEFPLFIGAVRVDAMEGNHPGGNTVYKLTLGQQSVVFCTDFEHSDWHTSRLTEFAADCSLLIYDAQYTPEEYDSKQGWGHSTWQHGVLAGRLCGAKRVVLTHHDPFRTDRELDEISELFSKDFQNCSFGKGGEEFIL